MATLTQDEIDGCRHVFSKFNNNKKKFDVNEGGSIDLWGLRNVLEAMGQNPSEADVFSMIIEAEEAPHPHHLHLKKGVGGGPGRHLGPRLLLKRAALAL